MKRERARERTFALQLHPHHIFSSARGPQNPAYINNINQTLSWVGSVSPDSGAKNIRLLFRRDPAAIECGLQREILYIISRIGITKHTTPSSGDRPPGNLNPTNFQVIVVYISSHFFAQIVNYRCACTRGIDSPFSHSPTPKRIICTVVVRKPSSLFIIFPTFANVKADEKKIAKEIAPSSRQLRVACFGLISFT